MKKLVYGLLAMLLLLLPAAGSGWADEVDELVIPSNPLAGRTLFSSKRCILCHSIQGIGGTTAPDLGIIQETGSFMDYAANIWNHMPRMNEAFQNINSRRPEFSGEEMEKLITFLYFLNFFDRTGEARLGERIFREKRCINCHRVGDTGGTLAPGLDKYQSKISIPFITSALWNNSPAMAKKMRQENIPRPVFKEKDVVDILAFIRVNGKNSERKREYLPVGNPQNGRKLFKKNRCSFCHAINGKKKIGPNLGSRELKGSISFILSKMWNVGPKMWSEMEKQGIPFPKLKPTEMSDLLSFLYSIHFSERPGSARKGEQLFVDKMCEYCHNQQGGGSAIAPDLGKMGAENSFDILASMWNHAPKIEEKIVELGIRWPTLEREEMRDILAYILAQNQ